MATADEKAARQAARDAAKQSAVVGQQRLAAEVPKAATAFPVRRLRSAGDLSRYAIGGFTDDPYAQLAPPAEPIGARGARAVKLPAGGQGSGAGRTRGVTPVRTTTPAGQLAARHGLDPAETRFLDRRAAGPSAGELRLRAQSNPITASQTQQLATRAGLAPAETAFLTKHASPYAAPGAPTAAPGVKQASAATRAQVSQLATRGGLSKAETKFQVKRQGPAPRQPVKQTGRRATAI